MMATRRIINSNRRWRGMTVEEDFWFVIMKYCLSAGRRRMVLEEPLWGGFFWGNAAAGVMYAQPLHACFYNYKRHSSPHLAKSVRLCLLRILWSKPQVGASDIMNPSPLSGQVWTAREIHQNHRCDLGAPSLLGLQRWFRSTKCLRR